MRPVTWIQLLICCVTIGQSRDVKSQDVRFPLHERVDSMVNPPLMKQAEQILRFDRTVMDIGTLTEDDTPQTYHFTCTNVSGKSIRIARVKTTCGCASASVLTSEMGPGETRTIAFTYNPGNHPGTIDTNAFVYLSSQDKAPVARITLIGNVFPGADKWARYPYAMGKLRLKQNRMEFREIEGGKLLTERILCGNGGDKPLRLLPAFIPKFATFRTEPEVIMPGSEADIVVTLDVSLIPAGRSGTFTFLVTIEGVDARPSDRTLTIKVNRINQQ